MKQTTRPNQVPPDRKALPAARGEWQESVEWGVCVAAILLIVYVLTAPPIILAHSTRTGDGSIPFFYDPLMRVAFSSFGAPILWYFNQVWHAGLMSLGRPPRMAWFVVLAYVVVGAAFLCAICLPFIRRKPAPPPVP